MNKNKISKKKLYKSKKIWVSASVVSLCFLFNIETIDIPIPFIGTHLTASAARNTYPTRSMYTTINYLDAETSETIAPSVFVTSAWRRQLKWRGDSMISAGDWYETGNAAPVTSPDLSSLGYEAPSDSQISPVLRAKPDYNDMSNVNLSRSYTVNVWYKHGTLTATSEIPGNPGSALRPSQGNSPVWPSGTTRSDLIKEVTRTINFVDSKGNKIVPSITQKTDLKRGATVDAVNGKFLNYSDFTTATFSQIEIPKLAGQGYSLPNPVSIIAVEVNGETQNSSIDVVYNRSSVSIDAKNSQLVIGPKTTWSTADNFVSATNQDGQSVDLKDITVTGTVDTMRAGDYPITYSYTDANGNTVSKTITVTLGDNGQAKVPYSPKENNTENQGGNTSNESKQDPALTKTTPTKKQGPLQSSLKRAKDSQPLSRVTRFDGKLPETGKKSFHQAITLLLATGSTSLMGFFLSRKNK